MRLPESPDLVVIGNPLLFQQQPPVNIRGIHNNDFQHNLQILHKSQLRAGGIGIAAPQIGWRARVLCIGMAEKDSNRYSSALPLSFWINPQITQTSKETCWAWEGCLSVPGMRGWVKRPTNITVKGLNEQGVSIEAALDGFAARVMLHEMDHLDGILFPDRMDEAKLLIPEQSMGFQSRWPKNWPTANARITPPGKLSTAR